MRDSTTPPAGLFSVEDEFQFRCSIRKGDRRENPRGGQQVDFKTRISEGLGVAKAKVQTFLQRTLPSARLISDDLYFKKSKGAPQSQYILLTDDNFEQMTKTRWDLISQRDVSSWETDGKCVLDAFFFEVFVYVHRRTFDSGPTSLRRATAARVEASARQIREYEERSNVTMGPITRQHVEIHHARQPEEAEFTMPNDNTTRQAIFLDQRREEAAREGEEGLDEERASRKIRIKLSGCWIDVTVDVNSLRRALGLPLHDIFRAGIFNDYVHHETMGPDIEDTDHGGTQTQRPPSAPAQTLTQASNTDTINDRNMRNTEEV